MALLKSEAENPESAQSKHLLLGTVSFTVCFAAWGLISAFAPHFPRIVLEARDEQLVAIEVKG